MPYQPQKKYKSSLLQVESLMLMSIVKAVKEYMHTLKTNYAQDDSLHEVLDSLLKDWKGIDIANPEFVLYPFSPFKDSFLITNKVEQLPENFELELKEPEHEHPHLYGILENNKNSLKPDEYCCLQALLRLRDNDNALLYARMALEMVPHNAANYLIYQCILHEYNNNEESLVSVLANPPEGQLNKTKSIRFMYKLVRALYGLLNKEETFNIRVYEELLSCFPQNKVDQFSFLLRLSNYAEIPASLLTEMVNLAIQKNPLENTLEGLRAYFNYKCGKHQEAYRLMVKADIQSYKIPYEELLELHYAYANILLEINENSKAFWEYKTIVENTMYQDTMSDYYFKASFKFIELCISYQKYDDAKNTFKRQLSANDEYLQEDFTYRYFSLKGDVFWGLNMAKKALSCYLKALEVENNASIKRKIKIIKSLE